MELDTIKAWKITEKNASLLSHLTGLVESTFTANIGWIVIEQWYSWPRFGLLPESVFNYTFPGVELSVFAVDKDISNAEPRPDTRQYSSSDIGSNSSTT